MALKVISELSFFETISFDKSPRGDLKFWAEGEGFQMRGKTQKNPGPSRQLNKIDYKSSGVDVQAGDDLVSWLQSQSPGPSKNILGGIGGFASVFRMPGGYKKPCLVTCTDGVGTKVKIAAEHGRLEGLGQDLVAMCVNDLVCTGGDPLLFLDYYAVGRLELKSAQVFLKSVRQACEESGLLLVGGETAEMPGIYRPPDFDCAGFAVGVVDEEDMWGERRVKPGQKIIALESSGIHSNGYSLVRKLFAKDMKKHLQTLLEPTRLYAKVCRSLKGQVHVAAAAHITGGGLENLPRVIPQGCVAELRPWKLPKIFQELQRRSSLSLLEMHNTFNCGVGFFVILESSQVPRALEIVREHGIGAWVAGEVKLAKDKQQDSSWAFSGAKL